MVNFSGFFRLIYWQIFIEKRKNLDLDIEEKLRGGQEEQP